jgi:hypothetical protein
VLKLSYPHLLSFATNKNITVKATIEKGDLLSFFFNYPYLRRLMSNIVNWTFSCSLITKALTRTPGHTYGGNDSYSSAQANTLNRLPVSTSSLQVIMEILMPNETQEASYKGKTCNWTHTTMRYAYYRKWST